MSYDLYLFEPDEGEDPMDLLERLTVEEEAADPDPAVIERNRRIADKLLELNPGYAESQLDYQVLAEQAGTSVDEARAKNRHIQLMDEDGLDLMLSDQQASISFPYWDSLDPARLTRQVQQAAEVISAETGWRLYDPQLEKFVDPADDPDEFRKAFDYGRDQLQRIVAEQDLGPRKKSLWQRLTGR